MKNILTTMILVAFSTITNANIFQVGQYEINARMAINTTSGSSEGLNDTFGIGRVNSISIIGGETYWEAGQDGEFLNFNFSQYETISIDPTTGNILISDKF